VTPRETFGALITREREAKGMIRVALATAAGISREALRRIEAGESGANEKTVSGLVKALALRDNSELMTLAAAQVGHGWHRLQSPEGGRWWVRDNMALPEARAVARALVAR
jgi:transcriptional regulator with XRE-family HTH domain